MKRILLTNFNIVNFTGSEIDTITIAKYLVEKGYDVDIFTLQYYEPLRKHVDERINVIDLNSMDNLKENYDLIWAHHYPLLDYLIFHKQIKAKKIVYLSLSALEPYEALPEYYEHLSLICVMSERTKEELIKECNIDREIYVFPNYAPNIFLEEKIVYKKEIEKICIISNHVPDELLEFKEIASSNNIVVDIFGMQHIQKYVDEKLLREYDVIISIGKTLFYSTAMGKPSYCYDWFGGYGYITRKNIEQCYKKNFSGRGENTKKTAHQIYEEITSGFSKVQRSLKDVRKFASKNYCLENNMEKILKHIDKCKETNCEEIVLQYPMLKRKSRLHIEIVKNFYGEIYRLNCMLIYQADKITKLKEELDYFEKQHNILKNMVENKRNGIISKIIEAFKK